MRKSFLSKSIIILTTTLLFFIIISLVSLNYINRKAATDTIENYMAIYLEELDNGQTYQELIDLPAELNEKIRITIIDTSGIVIADSYADISNMDNHIMRDEIVSARAGDNEKFVRKSDTIDARMMYLAVLLENGDYLRIAIPLTIINQYVYGYFIMVIMLLLLIGSIILFLIIKLNKDLISPLYSIETKLQDINSGNYDNLLPFTKNDEVNRILNNVDDLSSNIKSTIRQYELEKDKLENVLKNINQGIVAVDSDNLILLTNRAADAFLGINYSLIGRSIDYIFNREELVSSIKKINNKGGFKTLYINLDDTIYYCSISKIIHSSNTKEEISVMVLISDVTALKQNEKIREEFFTNSSHELKTPLTAIKGFTELISQKDVTKSDMVKYSKLINKNVDRMIDLIKDMINLSMIDNNVINEEKSIVDLRKLTDDVVSDLNNKAQSNEIRIDIIGTGSIMCYHNKARELISNLIDNAIKYNVTNGSVSVNIFTKDNSIVYSVIDTGIGIAEKYHPRLFERFYRVDKGRSGRISGTGLGLSIVKHICIIHNWDIKLSSNLGQGTTIKIIMKF